MFQQTATPEDLASTAFRPARAGAAPDKAPGAAGAPATHDPFLAHYFKRVDPRVAASFTPEQCEAIKSMFGARGIARPAVANRRSLPIGRGRYSLVLLLVREPRTPDSPSSAGTVRRPVTLLGTRLRAQARHLRATEYS